MQQSGAAPRHAFSSEHALKQELLKRALKHVGSQGWSVDALREAARELGYSPMLAGIFSAGAADLVAHFVSQCNGELALRADAAEPAFSAQPRAAQLRQALRWRLELVQPFVDTWPSALAALAQPRNLALAARLADGTAEAVLGCCAAPDGEQSAAARAAERAGVAAVYGAAELYLLSDYSPGQADTWEALDRSLDTADAARAHLSKAGSSLFELGNRLRLGLPLR